MTPPDFVVSKLEKRYWRQLVKLLSSDENSVEVHDIYCVAMLACNLASVDECKRNIRENGNFIEVSGDRGHLIKKRNPDIDLLKEAHSQVKHYLNQLKMSPLSRQNGLNFNDGWDQL